MNVGPAILAALLGILTVLAGWAAGRDAARARGAVSGVHPCSCMGKTKDNRR